MLEIVAIYYLCKKVGEVIREKGRKPLGYQILTACLWIGGEIFGAIVGAVISMAVLNEDEPGLILYVCAVGGAICGAGIAWLIAKMVSPLHDEDQYGRFDDEISCKSCGEKITNQADRCPVCGESLRFRPTF